ncbi:hypothetical protein ACLOJK_003156 [Asimina triloba]
MSTAAACFEATLRPSLHSPHTTQKNRAEVDKWGRLQKANCPGRPLDGPPEILREFSSPSPSLSLEGKGTKFRVFGRLSDSQAG